MIKIFLFLLAFAASVCFPTTSYSQEKKAVYWFGELHAGWQATLNDRPLSAQLNPGSEAKPFDSSKHYLAYFKNQVPVEMTVGFNNRKGFQFQLGVSYYSMNVALSNPPGVSGNEEYLFGNAGMFSAKVCGMIDYASLGSNRGSGRFHFIAGFSTGVTLPLSVRLDEATAKHFGIGSFQKSVVWTAGLELLMNIAISRHWYIANSVGFIFPIAGNIGQMQMQNNSAYSAGDPVKINSFKISTGIGIRF